MNKDNYRAIIILVFVVLIMIISGRSFLSMHKLDPIFPGVGVTEKKMLSNYLPSLKDTSGDTEIYVLKGEKPGGSILVLGGTHPNEPAGYISAVLMIENLQVERGTVFVIPRANRSAFTHNDPQEGHPQKFTVQTSEGERWFRYGSRATNAIDQWPDPEIYIHQSGQKLSGSETRNLNRAYPGRPDGNLTEKVAYGIMELINKENISISIDLHEASPEYPVINAIVAHERSRDLVAMSMLELEFDGLNFSMELSPPNFHGLSHREWGDYSQTMAILMESANPIQGRLRGRTTEELILTGQDECYVKADELNRLYVEFDENGHPLKERVGRHLTAIKDIIRTYNDLYFDKSIEVNGFPSYDELIEEGIGKFLNNSYN